MAEGAAASNASSYTLKKPNPTKKVKPGDKMSLKSRGIQKKSAPDLQRLQSLLAVRSRQQVADLSLSKAHSSGAGRDRLRSQSDVHAEASELEKFSLTYREHRCFSSLPQRSLFSDILVSLVRNRLCSEWIDHEPPESVIRILTCLRLLIRDPNHQKIFLQLEGISLLARHMESVAAAYVLSGEQPSAVQQLVTMTHLFQKLSAADHQRVLVMRSGAHRTLAKLLSTADSSVLLGALLALTALAESRECREEIGGLLIVENLLLIMQDYDLLSKRVSAELLRLVTPVRQVRQQVRQLESLPLLLSLLHAQHVKLLWSVAWILVQLCEDPDTRTEICSWGGVQQLLRLLSRERQFVSDRSSIQTLSSANASSRLQDELVEEQLSPQEEMDNTAALHSACCTVLTELSLDDSSAQLIVLENGVYVIAKLILPNSSGLKIPSLQCYAFRTLRFLFSVERNRHVFKRLFPTDLFEKFIDVGHYVRDLSAYSDLQTQVSLYTDEELDGLRENIEAMDQNRPPVTLINGYSILDHLGTGAFGSVFKVQKQSGSNLLALKEVNLHNPVFGIDKKSRDSNVEKIISELSIIREQMKHPNVVKYYKTFLEGDKLYIVMELIEGAPLAEHLNSLKEKQQKFTEYRIWSIFIQMCLALRYLHKEKRIIHRDLTPNNIMLGEKDKVTITDFGLAKQKQEDSRLTSVVGTILYCCPEVVKNEPYGEKADIWALGCILYQMTELQPPFYSNNVLMLVNKIVQAQYELMEDGVFSERVTHMIRWCLNPDADQRPDIIAISSRISDLMMRLMDGLYTSQNALERRAARDQRRVQRYFMERQSSRTSCCQPHLSQEKSSITKETLNSCSSAASPQEKTTSSGDLTTAKIKTRPASAGICVSQKKLRQIDDPVQRLLVQLHKIVFITQLPPAPHQNIRRRIIERFKRSLFHCGSDPYSLKLELSRLLQASPQLVEFGSNTPDFWHQIQTFSRDPHAADSLDVNLREGVTYQQMKALMEELLEESCYYNHPANSRISERRNEDE